MRYLQPRLAYLVFPIQLKKKIILFYKFILFEEINIKKKEKSEEKERKKY